MMKRKGRSPLNFSREEPSNPSAKRDGLRLAEQILSSISFTFNFSAAAVLLFTSLFYAGSSWFSYVTGIILGVWVVVQPLLFLAIQIVRRQWIGLEKILGNDVLTDIPQKSRFEEILNQEIRRCGRYRFPLALCLVDLDNFASLNEAFGKEHGDRIIKDFCFLMRSSIRFSDYFARYQDDLFCIILPHTHLLGAEKFLARIMAQSEERLDCSFSAGVTSFQTGEEVSEFFTRAEGGLRQAKREGKKRIRCIAGGRDSRTIVSL